MFGPLSARGTAARRARRTTIVIVGVSLLAALILGEIIDQVVNSQGAVANRTDTSYVAGIVPIIGESNGLAPLLGEIRGAPADLRSSSDPRAELDGWLAELQSDSASDQGDLTNLGLAAPSARAASLIAQTVADRAQLSEDLEQAVIQTTSGKASSATLLFSRVAVAIRSSDLAYRSFVRSLPKNAHAPPLPKSVWSVASLWTPLSLEHWTTALASAHTLAGRAAVKIIAIALDPPAVSINGIASPITTTTTTTTSSTTSTTSTTTTTTLISGATGVSGSSTSSTIARHQTTTTFPTTTTNQIPPAASTSNLPSTTSVTVTVVVANTGNIALSKVNIAATCVPTKNPSKKRVATSSLVSHTVVSLSPGGSRYVELGRVHTLVGASYLLTVTATPNVGSATHDRIKIVIG